MQELYTREIMCRKKEGKRAEENEKKRQRKT